MSTTVSDFLTNHVRTKVRDKRKRKYTDRSLIQYASEGQRYIAAVLGQYPECGLFENEDLAISIAASTEAGALPADFGGRKGDVFWVDGNSKHHLLAQLTRKELQQIRQDTPTVTGTTTAPRGWFIRGSNIHVIPQNTSDGWTLAMLYRITIDDLAVPASGNLDLDDRFVDALSLYVSLRAIGENERSDHSWARDFQTHLMHLVNELGLRDDEEHADVVENVHMQGMDGGYLGETA